MKSALRLLLLSALFCAALYAQDKNTPTEQPALTIYNQQFAVVRQLLLLELKSGANNIQVTDITTHVEPDSVILRPLSPDLSLHILEQNYRNDPVSEPLLLSLNEGKTIEFQVTDKDGNKKIVPGKIVRSGYVPHYSALQNYGANYYNAQMGNVAGAEQPIIEIDGKLQFTLPGIPLFPALADDTVLKPTLSWSIQSNRGGKAQAEFSYVTGGMDWHADYNVVAPPKGNTLELVGWVTLDNQSGKTFHSARIKLMAGDVNKIQPSNGPYMIAGFARAAGSPVSGAPPVSEKSFDEYHLYTLERSTTLHDRETKQVEFIRAEGIDSQSIYVYDGFKSDPGTQYWNMENIRNSQTYGTLSNPKVWVMQEFKNSKANHLGMPLPKGRVRFYRRDTDGQLEFTGENNIDHTPEDETVRLYTGNAFDVVGERRRTNFKIDNSQSWINETFEITLRNHKKEDVTIRVVEHLYRWTTWEIMQKSDDFAKKDSQTVEFTVTVPANSEKKLNYMVHYNW